MRFVCLLICCWWLGCLSVWANPVLPHVLGSHMVLQRGRDIHIWGWADPGEQITVTMGPDLRRTQASPDRRWEVRLPARAAGGPFTIVVSGHSTVTLRDVLVGEVWVASGQSNMTFALSRAVGGEAAAAHADDDGLRLFTVPFRTRMTAQVDTRPAEWGVCTPYRVREFSAVAYFFARQLRQRLGVPVGIIESAWYGTSGEEWTNPDALRGNPILRPIVDAWAKAPATVHSYDSRPPPIDVALDGFELFGDQGVQPISAFDTGRAGSASGSPWIFDWEAAPEATFDMTAGGHDGTGFAGRVHGLMDHAVRSTLSVTYRADGAPVDLRGWTGLHFWMRGRAQVTLRSVQPAITDTDDYEADPVEATRQWRQVTIRFADLHQDGWGVVRPFTPEALTGLYLQFCPPGGMPDRGPGGIFNGMVNPLLPLPLRGAIWYQGEGNVDNAWQYRTLLPTLIGSWRKGWREAAMPFLVVQLPNHGRRQSAPGSSKWAEFREAQALALRLPHTGLAVTIDVGEASDVHPHRKREVGERLALQALGLVYHQPGEISGPVMQSMRVTGSQARLSFLHADGLCAHDGPLKGFAVAGADEKFTWADATIVGQDVVLSSPGVPRPVAVRYAWDDDPECNLYNAAGLPACPFRTDHWPVLTQPRP